MTVHLVPWDTSYNLLNQTERLYEEAGTFDGVAKGDLVAVKLHVGELGNPYYVQPFFIHQIVKKIEEAGGKPFLADSSTYYLALRSNAVDHLETAKINGFNFAPFIVADGLRGENGRLVRTKGILKEIEVSSAIAEADAMVVVSHDKGHALTGFGGAIKNLGRALASAAYGVLSTFRKNKVSCVSFAENVTQFCDCVPAPGRVVINDIGVLASGSPVAVDAAFLQKADYKIFNEAYEVDCWTQVKELKGLGIKGGLKPKIVEIE